MIRNEEGKIVRTLSSGNDITRRKEVEEELRVANEELEKKKTTSPSTITTPELESNIMKLLVLLVLKNLA